MYPNPGEGLPIHAVKSVTMNGENYTYQYDANGNMEIGYDFTDPSNPAMRDIDYNADNMPAIITHETNGVTEYFYDGEGLRVKKVVNDTDKVYYVGDHYEVRDGEIVKYIFAGNLRLAMVDSSGNVYYYHKDHLGSTAAMTRVDSSAIHPGSEADYLPFGGYRRTSDSVTLTSYAFTDQEQDAESGLYNYNARLYDPVIGQFITPDSIIPDTYDPQLLNQYSYCRNNPLIYVDPSGHVPYDVYVDGQPTGTTVNLLAGTGSMSMGSYYSSTNYSLNNGTILKNQTVLTGQTSLNIDAGNSGDLEDNKNPFGDNLIIRSMRLFFGTIYMKLTYWHFEGRDLLNSNLPTSPFEARLARGTKLAGAASIYHDDPVTRGPEQKWIFEDGREAVYYSDPPHALVTNPRYKGTYNYVNPGRPSWNPLTWPELAIRATGHFAVDIVPYYIGGNQRGAY